MRSSLRLFWSKFIIIRSDPIVVVFPDGHEQINTWYQAMKLNVFPLLIINSNNESIHARATQHAKFQARLLTSEQHTLPNQRKKYHLIEMNVFPLYSTILTKNQYMSLVDAFW